MGPILGPGRRGRRSPMAEINVTPMVDVMLVLLIIFMVTAPLLATGVQVDLPESKAAGAEGGKHKAAAHGGKEFRVDGRAVAHRDVPADIERPANDLSIACARVVLEANASVN